MASKAGVAPGLTGAGTGWASQLTSRCPPWLPLASSTSLPGNSNAVVLRNRERGRREVSTRRRPPLAAATMCGRPAAARANRLAHITRLTTRVGWCAVAAWQARRRAAKHQCCRLRAPAASLQIAPCRQLYACMPACAGGCNGVRGRLTMRSQQDSRRLLDNRVRPGDRPSGCCKGVPGYQSDAATHNPCSGQPGLGPARPRLQRRCRASSSSGQWCSGRCDGPEAAAGQR